MLKCISNNDCDLDCFILQIAEFGMKIECINMFAIKLQYKITRKHKMNRIVCEQLFVCHM